MSVSKTVKHGFVVTVSDEDEDALSLGVHAWASPQSRTHYAKVTFKVADTSGRGQRYLHRIVMERVHSRPLSSREHVDHIDGNGLNCQRENMRVVSCAMNLQNRVTLPSNNTSGFRGVSYIKKEGKFRAIAKMKGKQHYLGRYDTAEEAAIVARQWRLRHMPGALVSSV